MNRFERFCRKYERFGIKNLMTIIVAGQAALGLLCILLGMSGDGRAQVVYNAISFRPDAFLSGEVWRLVSFLFAHDSLVDLPGGILWFALSLFFYFWVGRSLEAEWGRMKFTIYYFSGSLLALIFCMASYLATGFPFPASLFYLNLSLFFALATLIPNHQIRLYFVIPIKMKYLALAQAAIFIVLPIFLWFSGTPFPANLVPLLSILNYLIFFSKHLWGFVRRTPQKVRATLRTVHFASEVRRAKSSRGYIHKCAVCGRTDTELPDMEFRYCSLCAGYACYCADHIFDHPHKTIQ